MPSPRWRWPSSWPRASRLRSLLSSSRSACERAARAGQDVAAYVHHLIDCDIDAESLDAILAPVRRNFEESGMTDDDLAALVEEVREDIWREQHGRPTESP
jgi:hypothetical protein